MSKEISKTLESEIEAFRDDLEGGLTRLKRAGERLVRMLDENEDIFEVLIRRRIATLPWLEALERVGRGHLEPRLLGDPSPAAQRAVSQMLSINEQKRLLNGPVPVVVVDPGGGLRIEQKLIGEINTREAIRVVGGGKLRSIEDQRTLVKEQEEQRVAQSFAYTIDGDGVRFHTDRRFTWKQIVEIAEKIKPKAIDIEAEVKRRQVAEKK